MKAGDVAKLLTGGGGKVTASPVVQQAPVLSPHSSAYSSNRTTDRVLS